MIKVNLLRTSGLGGQASAEEVQGVQRLDGRTGTILALKILLIFLPIAGLYGWEYSNNKDLDEQTEVEQASLVKLQTEKGKYGDTGPRVELYTKQKQKVDRQIDTIRDLARSRLREVKAFDALQSLVPQRTWLKNLAIDKNVMKLVGYTLSDEGINDFMRALEGSTFFSSVEPKGTTSETLPLGQVKKFNLELHLGKSDKGVQ